MNQLFGQSEIEKLRDLDYKTRSHTFSKGVISAYYNLLEYPSIVKRDYIEIQRRKGKVYFQLRPWTIDINQDKDTIYSEQKTEQCKIKTKEIVYDLEQIFEKLNSQTRRGITLTNRKEIVLREVTSREIEELYQEWTEHKMNDPKVFRIAFTPKRYLRSFQLKEKGFNILQEGIYINGKLYGAICFELQNDIAFELAFISRFWDKELKIINDLNECILTHYFWKLWKLGIKEVNVGPTAGIKGLKVFKNKLQNYEHIIYSN